jgi:hypothetical protein
VGARLQLPCLAITFSQLRAPAPRGPHKKISLHLLLVFVFTELLPGNALIKSVIILSRVLGTAAGFGLVIGFINRLQLVTTSTITYNTVPDLHNLQLLHYNLLRLFPLVFTIRFLATDLNTGIIAVSQSSNVTHKSDLLITRQFIAG